MGFGGIGLGSSAGGVGGALNTAANTIKASNSGPPGSQAFGESFIKASLSPLGRGLVSGSQQGPIQPASFSQNVNQGLGGSNAIDDFSGNLMAMLFGGRFSPFFGGVRSLGNNISPQRLVNPGSQISPEMIQLILNGGRLGVGGGGFF